MFIGDTVKRNKLNNRGFAISTALYGLLTLTILILVLIFQVNRTGSNNSKELGEQIQAELDKRNGCITKRKECGNSQDSTTCNVNYSTCLDKAKQTESKN